MDLTKPTLFEEDIALGKIDARNPQLIASLIEMVRSIPNGVGIVTMRTPNDLVKAVHKFSTFTNG
ncbi:hypothetical protein WA1_30545 [Scytonema hofmannii PCC 7110]|uniref:Uncharacterized protein n=1 Tax=Scytonema hofmannii PCC 7110 TaxID=128403 RepID=A0A139X4T3_9CYAN|nr:hypothetical protein [Scytonema hofmannii]KYC39676.1 hypothetical protein WA1_30545 [Scytonema hofmannii PCC 7110]